MKALKSKLASQLLADPTAGDQLRDFLINKKANHVLSTQGASARFVVRDKNGSRHVLATVVPKAAKAA